MLDCYKTSLNDDPVRLRDAQNLFHRGISWMVRKVGRQWELAPCFGLFPLFKTKKAAYDAGVNLVLIASRYEAKKGADHARG